jgi:hypothetical protein
MYLPEKIEGAHVLILVKTYPLPTSSYGETVCTAGLLDGEKWIRIYPISWHVLKDQQRYPKYSWIDLDLVRNKSDFRPESYSARLGFDEDIRVGARLGTANAWMARKSFVLREVFDSMKDLLALAKSDTAKSLAVFKPSEIIDFRIEEEQEKEWRESWRIRSRQDSLLDLNGEGLAVQKKLIEKLPFKFSYKFMCRGESRPRELQIHDWELGALFWKCVRRAGGNEQEAAQQVRKKYFDEIALMKDTYLFLGTNFTFHRRKAPDPFLIAGVFYPPRSDQIALFPQD